MTRGPDASASVRRLPRVLLSLFSLFAGSILALSGCPAGGDSAPPAAPPPTILCAGDSITAASYPDRLRLLLEGTGHRYRVVNAGRGGNTSGEYLGFLLRSRILDRENPRWVLLQLGTNDVRIDGDATPIGKFQENLGEILDLVTRHRNPDGTTPRVLLATIPPVPAEVTGHFDASSRARVEAEVNPAIREIAALRGIPLVENHAVFQAHPEWLPAIHPTEEGYRALAQSWFEALAPLLAPLLEEKQAPESS